MNFNNNNIVDYKIVNDLLSKCNFCPHLCDADRNNNVLGFCRSDASLCIASVCLHIGEEPPISGKNGICNIFFSHCNLRCIYCQNHQISDNYNNANQNNFNINQLLDRVFSLLDKGIQAVGFVSPSHVIPQVNYIIDSIKSQNYHPKFIYNSNGYDNVDSLIFLKNKIDVYIPDFKYSDSTLAAKYSNCRNYPVIALKAIKEMYRQKGSNIIFDENGNADSGLIIRHLVLPGHIDNSISVLRKIANELTPSVYLSLMSQYYPTKKVKEIPNLNRRLNQDEYNQVVEEAERLGFYRGWIQEWNSCDYYLPDFEEEEPFKS